MSEVTYLGQPEIFWTAWEAIGTVLAVIIVLSIPQKMKNILYRPRLSVRFCDVSYSANTLIDSYQTNIEGMIQIRWFVENNDLFGVFGKDAINVTTTVWMSSKDQDLWAYQGDAPLLRILPRNEDWMGTMSFDGRDPEEGNYEIQLLFSMEGFESKKFIKPIEYKRSKL